MTFLFNHIRNNAESGALLRKKNVILEEGMTYKVVVEQRGNWIFGVILQTIIVSVRMETALAEFYPSETQNVIAEVVNMFQNPPLQLIPSAGNQFKPPKLARAPPSKTPKSPAILDAPPIPPPSRFRVS